MANEAVGNHQVDINLHVHTKLDAVRALQATLKATNAEVANFKNAMKGAQTQARSYNAELGKITRAHVTASPKNLRQLGQNWRFINTAMKHSSDQADHLGRGMQMVGQVTNSAFQQIKAGIRPTLQSAGAMDSLRLKMTVLQGQAVELGKHWIGMGKNIQWLGRQLMVGLTLPIAAFGLNAIQTFTSINAEFTRMEKVIEDSFDTPLDKANNKLADTVTLIEGVTNPRKGSRTGPIEARVADLSGAETVGDQYRMLARQISETYGVHQQVVAGVMADWAALGLEGEDLSNAIAGVFQTAFLGDIDLSEATNFFRSTMATFGKNLDSVSDKIAFATEQISFFNAIENETSLTMQEMAAAFPEVANTAQRFGLSAQELGAILAGMNEAGIDATEGAHALKFIMQRIVNPTNAASKAFEEMTGVDLNNIIYGAEGLDRFLLILNEINQLGPVGAQRLLGDIGQLRQADRMATALEQLGIGFANMEDPINDVGRALKAVMQDMDVLEQKTIEELEIKLQAPETQWAIIREKFRNVMYDIGAIVLPMVNNALDRLYNFIQKFMSLPDPFKKIIVGAVAAIALLGPMIFIFGQLFLATTSVMTGFLKLTGVIGGFIPGFGFLKRISLDQLSAMGRIDRKVLAMGNAYFTTGQKIKTTAADINLAVSSTLDEFAQAGASVKGYEEVTEQSLENVRKEIAKTVAAIHALNQTPIVPPVIPNAADNIDDVVDSVDDLTDASRRGTKIIPGLAESMDPDYIQAQSRAVDQLGDAVKPKRFSRFFDTFKNGIKQIVTFIPGIAGLTLSFTGLRTAIFSVLGSIASFGLTVASIIGIITTVIAILFGLNAGLAAATGHWDNFVKGLQSRWNDIKNIFTSIKDYFGPVVDAFAEAFNRLLDAISEVGNIFRETLFGESKNAREEADQWQTTGAAWSEVFYRFAQAIQFVSWLVANLGVAVANVVKWISNGIKWLADNWGQAFTGIANFMGIFLALFMGDWQNALRFARDFFIDILTTPILKSIEAIFDAFVSLIRLISMGMSKLGHIVDIPGTSGLKKLGDALLPGSPFGSGNIGLGLGIFADIADDVEELAHKITRYDLTEGIQGFLKSLGGKAELDFDLKLPDLDFSPFEDFPSPDKPNEWNNELQETEERAGDAGDALNGLADALQNAHQEMVAFLGVLKKNIDEIIRGAKDELLRAFQEMQEAARKVFEEGLEKALENFDKKQELRKEKFLKRQKQELQALEANHEAQLAVYDKKIEVIEKLNEADQERYDFEEYLQRKRELLRDRELNAENYRRERALAIYEGRIDDARQLDLQFQVDSQDYANDISDLEEQRRRDLVEKERDAQIKKLEVQRDALEKLLSDQLDAFKDAQKNAEDHYDEMQQKSKDHFLEEQEIAREGFEKQQEEQERAFNSMLDNITRYTPRNVEEMHQMFNDMDQLAIDFGMPDAPFNKSITDVTESMKLAFWTTTQDIEHDKFWKGEDLVKKYQWIQNFKTDFQIVTAAMVEAARSAARQVSDAFNNNVNLGGGGLGGIDLGGFTSAPAPTSTSGSTSGGIPTGYGGGIAQTESIASANITHWKNIFNYLKSIGYGTRPDKYEAWTNAWKWINALSTNTERWGSMLKLKLAVVGSDGNISKQGTSELLRTVWMRKYHEGGLIKMHTGGLKLDEVPIMAQKGEFMIRKDAVRYYGRDMMEAINNMRFSPPKESSHGINTASKATSGHGVTIFVDNFIGEKEWFESMMKEYDVKVVPSQQRKRGIVSRRISSSKDNQVRYR